VKLITRTVKVSGINLERHYLEVNEPSPAYQLVGNFSDKVKMAIHVQVGDPLARWMDRENSLYWHKKYRTKG